jgi:hypothetical protein
MTPWKGTLQHLRTVPSDHVQLLILVPSLTLIFLSLIVRTASSAIDPTFEKKKITDQLKQRLSEMQNDEEIKVTLTTKSSPQEREEASLPQWVPDSCSADPDLSSQCGASDSEGERGALGLFYRGELGRIQTELPLFTLRGRQAQFSLRVSPSRTNSEISRPVKGKAAQGPSLDVSLRVRVPQHGGDKLARRIVNLTIAFEQGSVSPVEHFGTVSGDFDGQGLSFGILQWNLKSGSLQQLLDAFRRRDNARFHLIMEPETKVVERLIDSSCAQALSLARRVMLDADGDVKEPWVARFRALGQEPIFQEVQIQHLLPQIQKAYSLADEFEFHSERAVALFFDILIQNGGIPAMVRIQYEQDVLDGERSLGRVLDEVERMRLLANRQAEAVKPKWVDTVRARKLTIADGKGSVNGISYNLDALGIRLRDYKTGKAVSLNNGANILKQLERRDMEG